MLVNLISYLLGDEDRLLTVFLSLSFSPAEQTRRHDSLRSGAAPQHHRQQSARLQSSPRRSHQRIRQPLRRLLLRTRLQMDQRRREAHGGRLCSPRNVPYPSPLLAQDLFTGRPAAIGGSLLAERLLDQVPDQQADRSRLAQPSMDRAVRQGRQAARRHGFHGFYRRV